MDIVIIGAQKAGTTWLFSMLMQHPQVCFSFEKEVHYFDQISGSNFDAEQRLQFLSNSITRWSGIARLYERKYKQKLFDPKHAFTDQWYKDSFQLKPSNWWRRARYGKVIYCDATPSYCAMSETGVRHMAMLLPDITPILIVRDPVKRMISGLSMSLSRKSGSMKGGTQKHIRRLRRKQSPRGDYARMIPLFRKYFGDITIIPFGRIHTDPLGLMKRIELQYGLNHIQYRDLQKKQNSHTGKVDLKPEVLIEIERLCAPQYKYLAEEFGQNFLNSI